MAAVVDQNMLLGKLKKTTKGAWQESAKVAPKAKGSQIPPGLVGAIARITKTVFAGDRNGAPYFMLHCCALEPAAVAGRQFTKLYSLAEPKTAKAKTVRDKLDAYSNDIQLLGCVTEGTTEDDLPGLNAELGKRKPYFEFNTWQPPVNPENPNDVPQVFVFIQKELKDYTPPAGVEVVEDTDETPEPEAAPAAARARGPAARPGVAAPAAEAPKAARGPARTSPAPDPEPEPEPTPFDPEPEPDTQSSGVQLKDCYYFTYKGVKECYEIIAIPEDGFVDIQLLDASGNYAAPARIFKKLPVTKLEGE